MKNIIKTLIVMLTSISLFSSANAGELNVSGTAKATYNIHSGNVNQGKGLGVTNELNFTAAGELDNGYTWSYSMELDPGATTAAGTTDNSPMNAQNDDTKLTLTTPMGTVGVFISEGGLDLEDGASQSVYARPTDIGDPTSGAGDNFTIDAYNNVQYHMPADMLPFGIVGKVAYAPDLDTTYGSGNNKGRASTRTATHAGTSATELQVKAAPIDGLTIGASYMNFQDSGHGKLAQENESGSVMATFAQGPYTVGISRAMKAPLLADHAVTALTATTVEFYKQTNMSVAYAYNDNLSLSYEIEKDQANYVTGATANLEQKSKSLQAAYTMGGMTLAVALGRYDNASYVDGSEIDTALFAVTMAF